MIGFLQKLGILFRILERDREKEGEKERVMPSKKETWDSVFCLTSTHAGACLNSVSGFFPC